MREEEKSVWDEAISTTGTIRDAMKKMKDQEVVLGLRRNGQDELVDGVGNAAPAGNLHAGGVLHEASRALLGVLVEGGREEQRLP